MRTSLLVALFSLSAVLPASAASWTKDFNPRGFTPQGPGVPGQSHIAEGEAELPISDCGKVMATWEELWVAPLRNAGMFEDHAGVCFELGSSAYFAYSFVAEPFELADLPRFQKLLSELSQIEAYGMRFEFKRLEKLSIKRAVMVQDEGNQRPHFKFVADEQRGSMIEHYAVLEKENTYFRKPEPQVFLDFVRETTPAMDFSAFLAAIHPADSTVSTNHTPRFHFANGDVRESAMSIGNIRQCFEEDFACIP